VAGGLAYLVYVSLGRIVDEVGGRPLQAPDLSRAVAVAAWLLVVLAVAEAVRVQSAHFAEVARFRAEQARSRAEQARARAEQERRQASEERLRIARELHDVLGHHLSLINVQAGVGLHLMDAQPEQARAALTAIKSASAEALREVRSVLGVLRPEEEAAPRTPAPGLHGVTDLAAEAGTAVRTEVVGVPRPVPAEVDRATYRIVQEALTNVRRHAGDAASASVTIEYGETELTAQIDDDGAGAAEPPAAGPPAAGGTGIAGMRERAVALGGELTAGTRPEGGFRVRVQLPLPPADETPSDLWEISDNLPAGGV